VHFLIANGGEGSHHHVEPVEPRPALDVVISGGAHQGQPRQRRRDDLKVAQGFHKNSFKCQVSSFMQKQKAAAPPK
jgi:hypothetical protein